MAKYRSIQTGFWSDSKIIDDFTPEDRYFYLYLLTNEKSNQLGCYELSIKQMCRDTGYNEETIKKLLDRFENILEVINYDDKTKEIFLKNWYKYNWLESYNTKLCIDKEFSLVKSTKLRGLISPLYAPYMPLPSNKKKKNNKKNNNNKNNNNIFEGEEQVPAPIDTQTSIISSLVKDLDIQETLKDFLKMRKLIKKPMTERALKQLIKKLFELSNEKNQQLEILDQSIINNWASVYPLKQSNQKQKEVIREPEPDWLNKQYEKEEVEWTDEQKREFEEFKKQLLSS